MALGSSLEHYGPIALPLDSEDIDVQERYEMSVHYYEVNAVGAATHACNAQTLKFLIEKDPSQVHNVLRDSS